MTLLRLENVSRSYGATPIFQDISWQIEDGQRIGLIGPNGSGKTTLFRLMVGELSPDQGAVHRVKGLEIGYMRQEPVLDEGTTLFQTMKAAFGELIAVHDELRALEEKMSTGDDDPKLFDRYSALQERYEREGGYTFESQIKAVLLGLGFENQDLDQPVSIFSGGEKSRIALAQLLVKEPSLLLLDEPTNHLDINATEWLEQYLMSYQGTVILVSHDRFFLDRVVRDIVEIENLGLEQYPGDNYSAYVEEKEKRVAKQQKLYEQQQEEIERLEDYVRRNIAGQKTKQAQSRRKVLEKMERMERPKQRKDIRLRFAPQRRGGNDVLHVEGLSKAYGNKRLFRDLSLVLRRSERVGILGPNGSGKTTLLKILIGAEDADAGWVRIGHNIDVGYYDQTLDDLNKENTVLDEVWEIEPWATQGAMRDFLGRFLFSGEDVFRIIDSLSGGEQSRLALAKLILSKVNLLILDEPTNHLDIPSRMVLEGALSEYDGTVLVVSHDRYFLNKLVQRILYLQDGVSRIYEGNYSYFEWKRNEERAQQLNAPKSRPTSAHQWAYRKRRQEEKARRKREKQFSDIENEIVTLEDEISRVEDLLASEELALDWPRLDELTRERQRLKECVDRLYEAWGKLEASP